MANRNNFRGTKMVMNFLTQNFKSNETPEKIKSEKGGAFISKDNFD